MFCEGYSGSRNPPLPRYIFTNNEYRHEKKSRCIRYLPMFRIVKRFGCIEIAIILEPFIEFIKLPEELSIKIIWNLICTPLLDVFAVSYKNSILNRFQ